MTIEEINKRLAEIKARTEEISKIAQDVIDGVNKDDNLDDLTQETDKLQEERSKLKAEALKIRAEITDDKNFRSIITSTKNEENRIMDNKKITSTQEYREAFMTFVRSGKVTEVLKRADSYTQKGDVASVVVPTTITDQLFKRNPNAGALYDLVTKTNHPFGMNVATTNTEFEIEWVAERATSDKKKGATSVVSFTGYKGLIKFVQSFETSVMALPEFEKAMVEKMLEGARKSFDKVIVAGTGSGQPKGILKDIVYTGSSAKAIKMSPAEVNKYATWLTVLAKVPKDKKATGSWVMNESDWTQYILGMVNDNGTPIAVERAGVDGMPKRFFLGRPVVTLENQGLSTFDTITGNATASETTTFALFVDLADYWLNLNKDITLKDYADEETDDQIKKLIVLADGKLVDITSAVAVCKGVASAT